MMTWVWPRPFECGLTFQWWSMPQLIRIELSHKAKRDNNSDLKTM